MILTRKKLYEFSGIDRITESVERRAFSVSNLRVFLSHKHTDLKELWAVKKILEGIGARPYVDWMDKSMPDSTSAVTASKIKTRIQNCNKFIFVATSDALCSPWCNWEIGFADAYKHHSNAMALFAIYENDGDWEGNEYMQLYPVIDCRLETGNRPVYYVKYPKMGTSRENDILLKEWLLK